LPTACRRICRGESGPVHGTRIIHSGKVIRIRTLDGGVRQILGFLLPRDSIGLYGALFPSSHCRSNSSRNASWPIFAVTN
jgi:CRP-like cAMP-binding protein